MTDGQKLLTDYAQNGSEAAFRELVARYVDLVYSSAVRLVNGDTHLAEDVTQTVFADLAKVARSLSREVMLGGWLHRHTCFIASKTLRAERRRLARERQAAEMNSLEDHSAANLASVAPILDEAINQLGAEDRTAILLRFFEQRDFQSLGQALGSNEEAARKRVNRALDKLEVLLKRRGVTLSATALAATLGTQAVTAAPAGLALTISTVALTGAATSGTTTLTLIKIMSMTKLKIGVVAVIVAAGVAIPLMVMQQQSQTKLRETQAASQKQADEAARLAAENARLASELARARTAAPPATASSSELLKLRSKVGQLTKEKAAAAAARTNGPSTLSGITADPEMRKMIRDQQKMGMTMIYKDFSKRAKLPTEQGEKLNDLLADDVMDNIDKITEVLAQGKSPEEIDAVFAAQEAALQAKVKDLIGPDAYEKYHDYTKNLGSYLTAEQFKATLTGEKDAKDAKSKQLYELMQTETQQALAAAGLSPEYQIVPTLNFRNIASEAASEKSLGLLENIYDRVATHADSFLTADEITKFKTFRTTAINNNRLGLKMNRQMMAPGGRGPLTA